jgi:uncharacterized protein YbjQ (UPF0145 family)
MKKSVLFFLGVLLALALMGCRTTVDFTTNKVGWSDYAVVAVKDFEPMGVVTVTATEVLTAGPFEIVQTYTGSRVTYADLMAEAVKLGADDIINVRIDVNGDFTASVFDRLTGWNCTYTYTGTALAIKYGEKVDTKTQQGHFTSVRDGLETTIGNEYSHGLVGDNPQYILKENFNYNYNYLLP